jgi:DNA-binding response OmpR family regulator
MPHDQALEKFRRDSADAGGFPWDFDLPGRHARDVELRPPASYRHALGEEPIRVGIVEFRIMLFLASWPYHAFTPHQIAAAASTARRPVAEAAVDDHIAALRDQLGVLHDFVQTVPHVGYRFKA